MMSCHNKLQKKVAKLNIPILESKSKFEPTEK